MLDIQFVRDHVKEVKKATTDKGFDGSVLDKLITIDVERRTLIQEVETIRAKKNKLGKAEAEQGRLLKQDLKVVEEKLNAVTQAFNDLMMKIPNPSAPDVKVGK